MADVAPTPPAAPFTGEARTARAQWQTPLDERTEQLLPPRPISDSHQVAARMAAVQRALDEAEKTALREELIIVQRQARSDVLQERFAGLETQRSLEAQLINAKAELLVSGRARTFASPQAQVFQPGFRPARFWIYRAPNRIVSPCAGIKIHHAFEIHVSVESRTW